MAQLHNLIVDLDARFQSIPTPQIVASAHLDDRVLAWIDDEFGGSWSSEAHAATNAVAYEDGSPTGFASFDPQGLRFSWLRGLAREPGVGTFGPFGVTKSQRGTGLGRLLLGAALAALRDRGYARALIPAVGDDRLVRYYADACGATVAETFERERLTGGKARAVVMASGSGTNLQAVLEAVAAGTLPIEIAGVVSNVSAAPALERARKAGVANVVALPWKRKEEARGAYDARLIEAVGMIAPDVVLLLGWMHLLGEPFVRAFPNLLNLHPAFLPLDPERDEVGMPDGTSIKAFRGANAVADALAANSAWVGATVHVVTPATDRGPVMIRKPLKVERGDDEASIMKRLHPLEHRIVSAAVMRWLYERA